MENNKDIWAVVELMGHVTLAGAVTKPGENGGLWQIDIPEGDSYRTEFFGSQAVYRIRIVSEEIARGYALPSRQVIAWDVPILRRDEHESAVNRVREDYEIRIERLKKEIRQLGAGDQGISLWDEKEEDEDPEEDE